MEDYSNRIPLTPPDGALEYMINAGAFQREYMVYRVEYYRDPLTGQKEKGIRCTCSACGGSGLYTYVAAKGCHRHSYVPAPFGFRRPEFEETVFSGDSTLCPDCGAEVKALHIGQMGNGHLCEERLCMTVGRLDDKLLLTGWLFQRQIDKNGKVEYVHRPYQAYVIEKKRIVRLMAYRKCITSISFFNHWEQREKYVDGWGVVPWIMPWDADILIGSTAENSKLDLYLRHKDGAQIYPVSYLKVWQKHPQIENLLVQGAVRVVTSAINSECSSYGWRGGVPRLDKIFWKENRPAQMLGLNKEEFRVCCQEGWSFADVELYRLCRAEEKISLPRDFRAVQEVGGMEYLIKKGKEYRYHLGVMRIVRYILKQREKTGREIEVSYLRDYWRMAEQLEYPMTDTGDLLPKDLRRAHDRVVQELNEIRERAAAEKLAKEMETRRAGFEAAYNHLLPFSWELNGILIRPCKDEEELRREGKMLSHCVGSYAQRVADGKTAIFFIRKADEPDRPWYTLELNEKALKVEQNRGARNCERTPEVSAFELQWLERLRAIAHSNKKKKEILTA